MHESSRITHVACRQNPNSPKSIRKTVSDEMNSRSTTWKGMSDSQVKTLVINTRSRENGGDIFRLLERPPLCMVQRFQFLFFLQSYQTIINNDTQKLDRIVVFGNPSLFGLFAGAVQLFIDGTFRICPSQFYQCLIIMVFDVQTASFTS